MITVNPPKGDWYIHDGFTRIGTFMECGRLYSLYIKNDKWNSGGEEK